MRIRLTVEHDDRKYDITYEPESEETLTHDGKIIRTGGPTLKEAIADVFHRINIAIGENK